MKALFPTVLLLAAFGCGDTDIPTQPTPPSPTTLSVLYQQAAPPSDWQTATGCTHQYSPLNLSVRTDWKDWGQAPNVRLDAVSERLFQGSIAGAAVGEHWLMLVDVTLCRPAGSTEPFVTSGVSLNGVELRRVIQVQESAAASPRPALAFTVSMNGTVQP